MQPKQLGQSTLSVSPLCLGTMTYGWTTPEQEAFSIMDAALEHGINFFDTANIYSRWVDNHSGGESETIIGKWLNSKQRDQIILATKVRGRMWDGFDGEGLSRAHIMRAVEDSLQRLQTDYIDLYQVHWYDADTPIDETLRAMDDLITAGKVRAIGASNHPAWRLTKSFWMSDINNLVRYESLQPHYSLLHRDEFERELAELCLDQQVGVIPYSPLAAGFLTGKYNRHTQTGDARGTARKLAENPKAHDVMDTVRNIASGYNVPPAQVALAWLMAQPVVTAPIIGARTLNQFNELIGVVNFTLNAAEVGQLSKQSQGF